MCNEVGTDQLVDEIESLFFLAASPNGDDAQSLVLFRSDIASFFKRLNTEILKLTPRWLRPKRRAHGIAQSSAIQANLWDQSTK